MSTSPPGFTFKQFSMAIRLHGVVRLLQLFLQALKPQHTNGSFDLALDVLFSIICAPTSSSSSQTQQSTTGGTTRLTLADALRLEYSTSLSRHLSSSSDANNIIPEAIVRLNRRLETLSLVVLPQSMDAAAEAEAAEAAAAVGMPDDLASIDLTNMNNMNDMNLQATAANGEINANTTTADDKGAKDMIDQILESTNNAVDASANNNNVDPNNPSTGDNGQNNNGGFDLGSMFVDLDSANLGLGNDFDLEMEGMF